MYCADLDIEQMTCDNKHTTFMIRANGLICRPTPVFSLCATDGAHARTISPHRRMPSSRKHNDAITNISNYAARYFMSRFSADEKSKTTNQRAGPGQSVAQAPRPSRAPGLPDPELFV